MTPLALETLNVSERCCVQHAWHCGCSWGSPLTAPLALPFRRTTRRGRTQGGASPSEPRRPAPAGTRQGCSSPPRTTPPNRAPTRTTGSPTTRPPSATLGTTVGTWVPRDMVDQLCWVFDGRLHFFQKYSVV